MQHVLIDFENVQPTALAISRLPKACHIWLFLGVHQQKNLPYSLVKALLNFPTEQLHLVELQRTGKNALDHYLAFYLGKISQMDSEAEVCILARDSGYDVLVEHLNATHQGLVIERCTDVPTLAEVSPATVLPTQPVLVCAATAPPSTSQAVSDEALHRLATEAYHQAANKLKAQIDQRAFVPQKKANLVAALQKYVLAQLLQPLPPSQQQSVLDHVIEKLAKYGLIEVDSTLTITYHLSDAALRENIARQVKQSHPKTVDKLTNVISQHLIRLPLPNDATQVKIIIHWLKQKAYIYQQHQQISYTPPAIPTSQPQPAQRTPSTNTDAVMLAKAVKILTSKLVKNRPNKRETLNNALQSQLQLGRQATDRVIDLLQANKTIDIPNQGKIIYHV